LVLREALRLFHEENKDDASCDLDSSENNEGHTLESSEKSICD